MNKKSLLAGILLGIAVVVSLGIVYIDNVKHYFYQAGGLVQMFVNTNFVFNVNTNTGSVGFGATNTTTSFEVRGKTPGTNTTGNGTLASTTGRLVFQSGNGGGTFETTSANGGGGGTLTITSGNGGNAPLATTNATGGAGGGITITTGGGASSSGVATNATTGGNAGLLTLSGGSGGSPTSASTNTVGGNGGGFNMTGGGGGTPSGGWARKSGSGGAFAMAAGNSGASQRTNSGNGGSMTLIAGNSGNVTTAPGNPGNAGDITMTAGNGGTGDTNANGGSHYFLPGTGAITGSIVVGRDSAGVSRGGLQVGPIVAGTTATLTNLLSITAVLDFPSLAAGTVADLPIAFAGAADGDVVTLAVPLASVTNCMWMAFASNAVVYVRALNGQLVSAQDPNSGQFRVVVNKFR